MSLVAAIVVGVPIGVGIGWLVWNFWNSNRLLDSRLAVGAVSYTHLRAHET